MKLKPLNLAGAEEAGIYGGKAKGLAQLSKVGAPIPPTLCIELEASDFNATPLALLSYGISEWIKPYAPGAMIVRSSASTEDSLDASSAGLFESHKIQVKGAQDTAIVQTLKDVGSPVLRKTGRATVLLQPFIKGYISGVIFTAHPVTGYREPLISYAIGGCADIVAGTAEVQIIVPSSSATQLASAGEAHLLGSSLDVLCATASRLESHLGHPLDIEFTITQPGGNPIFLQARPLASLTMWRGREGIVPLDLNSQSYPSQVAGHPKITLRRRCHKFGVPISKAWIATETSWRRLPPTSLPISEYAIVLILPDLVNGKVQRVFSKDAFEGAAAVLASSNEHWVRHALIKEIITSRLTGIAALDSEGAVVEVAFGHFIPKGVVETAIYKLINRKWVITQLPVQEFLFDIDSTTGSSVQLACGKQAKLTSKEQRSLADLLDRIELTPGEFLEFGISEDESAFVIDIQSSSSKPRMLNTAISPGTAEGLLLKKSATSVAAGISKHLREAHASKITVPQGSNIILASWLPNLGLAKEIEDLEREGFTITGMIFGVYSPLCHLALLLRERGTPAVVAPQIFDDSICDRTRVRLNSHASYGSVELLDP